MQQRKFERRFWLGFAAVTVAVIMVAAVRWSLDHPYGVHWDEAEYFNNVQIDVQRLHSGMVLKLGGRLLLKTFGRPPAFRLLALPFLALFGFRTVTARLVPLACFGLSSWFIYLAARRIASVVAGAFAVLVFALSPEVVSASIFFGTDASLYLATSAMLYYLFATWSDKSEQPNHWIGLGLALGLGFLAKTSFMVIALPVLALWFVLGRWGRVGIPSLVSQWKAAVLALLVAGPWWLLNIKGAFAYGRYARGFVRNSLGTPSLATWMRWLSTVIQALLGHGISILIGLVLLAVGAKVLVMKETILDPLQRAALGACACAGVPLLCAQLSGTNHLLRHVSPVVIPLAIVVGVLSDKTGWAHSGVASAVSCILCCVQAAMLVAPVVRPNTRAVDLGFVNGALPWRVMARFDQWDWRPVQAISDGCGLQTPRISYLGNGREFNKPQIEFPWVERSTSAHGSAAEFPEATWLWRYENGPLNWQQIMNSADQSDIVLTAPHFAGEARYKEDLDNEHNAEFADRLSRDLQFREPIRLQMGRFEPVEVFVFLSKTLECGAPLKDSGAAAGTAPEPFSAFATPLSKLYFQA
jgi:4-amino-4-deoxy-L-arabinose transferase-like glycosyltransferase